VTRFEFLSALISTVIALGSSEVTVAWGRLIQDRARVPISWLHAFWLVFALFLLIQFWWGFWNFRIIEKWSLLSLTGVVVEAITLVV
jgi:hypothetical protein